MNVNRTKPVCIEAEQQVLGSILQDEGGIEALSISRVMLKPEDFYKSYHWDIFQTLVEMADQGKPLTDLTSVQFQNLFKRYPDVNGHSMLAYIEYLKDSTPTAANITYYCQRLRELSKLREIIDLTYQISEKAFNYEAEDITSKELLSDLQQGIATIGGSTATYVPEFWYEPEILSSSFPELSCDLLNVYCDLFKGVTEAPRSYHAITFLVSVGVMLGRRIKMQYGLDLYPNIFALIIGRSGRDRKDTALSYGRKLARQIDQVNVLANIASYEGLCYAMSGADTEPGIDASRCLVVLSEFDGLLRKARMESTSNLIMNLCDAYDADKPMEVRTKNNPIRIPNPFLSINAAIQPGILESAFKSGDIDSGFAGRFLYVLDYATEVIPRPKPVDMLKWNDLIRNLSALRDEWVTRAKNKPDGAFTINLDSSANSLWDSFYIWQREQNKNHEILSAITERIHTNVMKLAMVFAALDDMTVVGECHLNDAVNVGKWVMENIKKLFGNYGKSEVEKCADVILESIKTGTNTRREIQMNQCRIFDKETFARAITNLLKAGLIGEKKSGRKMKLYIC